MTCVHFTNYPILEILGDNSPWKSQLETEQWTTIFNAPFISLIWQKFIYKCGNFEFFIDFTQFFDFPYLCPINHWHCCLQLWTWLWYEWLVKILPQICLYVAWVWTIQTVFYQQCYQLHHSITTTWTTLLEIIFECIGGNDG